MDSSVNVGGVDRLARFLLGPGMVAAGMVLRGKTGYALVGAGAILFSTAVSGYCPINATFRVNTAA